jgi:HD-like signal output (HDOD) protein/DNA-binding NarL/FixJ family response regulator
MAQSEAMPRILIIDDSAVFRDPLTASLRSAGYQAETAKNGKEGLARAQANRPDLIIIDVAIPEMDGLKVVQACRADPALKYARIIILSVLADRETILTAARLGITDYLLKSRFSMNELLERVRKHIGGSAKPEMKLSTLAESKPKPSPAPATDQELPRLLTRQQCLDRIEHAVGAKSLSGVVAQVLSMANSPLADLSELASLIGRDPVLSTRVLRAANSAAFAGARRVVTNIPDAVRNIGMSTVRNIATALSVYEAIPCGGADGYHHIRGWQHSFATAMICQQLAAVATRNKIPGMPEAGAAYLIGLCHDLGQILFRSEFGKEYTKVLATHAAMGLSLDHLERQMLGTTQLDLAKVILKKLSLPDGIRAPIEEFHIIRLQPGRHTASESARLLRLADLHANGMLMAALTTSEVSAVATADCRAALGADHPPRPDPSDVRGQILALTPLLARLPPEEEDKLSRPLLENTNKRVWLMRDSSFSKFDPLETALEALANVKVSENPPVSADECDALVIEARQRMPSALAGIVPVLRLSSENVADATPGITECGVAVPLERLAAFLAPQNQVIAKAA